MKAFRHHETKLRQIRPALNLFETFKSYLDRGLDEAEFPVPSDEEWEAQLAEQVNSDLAQKMRGFYVDLTEEDVVLEPTVITGDDARDALFISTAARLVVQELLDRGGAGAVEVVEIPDTPPASSR